MIITRRPEYKHELLQFCLPFPPSTIKVKRSASSSSLNTVLFSQVSKNLFDFDTRILHQKLEWRIGFFSKI
jgi:hypothetical protein